MCSPFAALSGRGDSFTSLDDLVRSVREGVLLDIAAVPTVTMVDRHGQVGGWVLMGVVRASSAVCLR